MTAPVHYGFLADKRAKCGKRSLLRTTSPAEVSCVGCLSALNPFRIDPKLTREQRAKATTLAAISGQTVPEWLERRVGELLDGLPEPLKQECVSWLT